MRQGLLAILLLLGAAAPAAAASVVVSGDSLATEAGRAVLAEGGNAVDGDGRAWGLDFRETAPAASDPLTYRRLDEAGVEDPSLWGATAGGVPGTAAGPRAV